MASLPSPAGIQPGDTLGAQGMAEVLLAQASDAYRVAFAFANIDPAFATSGMILAEMRWEAA
jgi:hypothetical protein